MSNRGSKLGTIANIIRRLCYVTRDIFSGWGEAPERIWPSNPLIEYYSSTSSITGNLNHIIETNQLHAHTYLFQRSRSTIYSIRSRSISRELFAAGECAHHTLIFTLSASTAVRARSARGCTAVQSMCITLHSLSEYFHSLYWRELVSARIADNREALAR
jgi:hypothetical protein